MVLDKRCFTQPSFSAQKLEEPRDHACEWVRHSGTRIVPLRRGEAKHLLDGTTEASHRSHTLHLRILFSVPPQPSMAKRLDMSRKIRQCLRSGALSGLPESDKQ